MFTMIPTSITQELPPTAVTIENPRELTCLIAAILMAPHWVKNDSEFVVNTAIERALDIVHTVSRNFDWVDRLERSGE
jgi:hypothetical protein